MVASTAPRAVLSPENRKLFIALAGVLALAFAFVGSNVAANHEPKPHNLPVGVVGSPQATGVVARQLDRRAPGAFAVKAYRSPAAARAAILHRRVYGAFEPGRHPALLVASAGSRPAALVLEQTFRAATRGQGRKLVVRDVVALPRSDSGGATTFAVVLSLLITGVMGSSVVYLATQHRSLAVRLAALVALGTGAGLLTALATNVVIGAFHRHFLAVWGVATLLVLALALPIAAFQVLLGLAGTGVGLIVFIVVGDPAAGGGTAPELLPGLWRAVSQLLPPGAGTTAMRDTVYFNGHGATRALLVLGMYAFLGATGAVTIGRLRARPEPATAGR